MMRIPILLSLILLLSACGGGETQPATTTDPATGKTGGDDVAANTVNENATLYSWVENLNLRSTPSTSGEVIASVQPNDPLERLETSAKAEAIVLRGVLYDEPWIKVKTATGDEGWVFGGAVKRQDEIKGNQPFTDEYFYFPVFGEYNLSGWKELPAVAGDDEGDFDTDTRKYQLGDQILSIYRYDGEYGYGHIYTLETKNGRKLKKRHFSYNNDGLDITETVEDYTSDPAKEYSRSQKATQSSFQLSTKPIMLSGPWTEKVISAGE